MANMAMVINDPASPSGRRAKPKLALRGSRRHAVQRLLHYLRVVDRQDGKEAGRAEELGYTPYLFVGELNSDIGSKLGDLIFRCTETLRHKI